ncbi:MAG: hypothetical protein CAK86_00900 [Opitutia bacterium AMD-G1]|nr:MAG: hypothetical protein CAK86_00900 [Opitutae bacterium AMD-G1]
MQIHVARNSVQLGVFVPEDIVAGLSTGRFHASDLAWRDGLPAWTPLGDWPEFRAVGVPASPGVATPDVPPVSTVPWEQGKSLGSFFATIKAAVVNPSVLSTGRYAFGDWVVFCYLGVLFSLPFQLVNAIVFGDKNAEVAEWLRKLNIAELSQTVEQMAKAEPAPVWITVFGAGMGLAIAPFIYAFFGVLHWLGQRVFRYQVPLERTVAASLLVAAILAVLMAPLQLLAFNFGAQMVISSVFFIPALVVYFRCFGAATGVSPWKQFGISSFVWFVLCCCCCALPGILFWWAAATR